MSFHASYQKPASEGKHESPSRAPAVKEIHNHVSYWPAGGRVEIYLPIFDGDKSILEGFVNDANFLLKKWHSTSPSSSTPSPTRSAWTSLKVRQKEPQSLAGIRNRETISKDNTGGYEARINDLLATSGKKVMAIKHQAPLYINALAGPGATQENARFYAINQSSKRRPDVLATNNGDSYIDHRDGEDGMLNNTSPRLVREDYRNPGEDNSFSIPTMDGNKWINPRAKPWFATCREDSSARQVNGVGILVKERKNNIRGRDRSQRRKI